MQLQQRHAALRLFASQLLSTIPAMHLLRRAEHSLHLACEGQSAQQE